MPFSNIRLGTTVQSVEADLVHGQIQVRVVVPQELLSRHLGAGCAEQTWLDAFQANAAAIEEATLRAYRTKARTPIVLSQLAPTGPS